MILKIMFIKNNRKQSWSQLKHFLKSGIKKVAPKMLNSLTEFFFFLDLFEIRLGNISYTEISYLNL